MNEMKKIDPPSNPFNLLLSCPVPTGVFFTDASVAHCRLRVLKRRWAPTPAAA